MRNVIFPAAALLLLGGGAMAQTGSAPTLSWSIKAAAF